MSKLQSWIKASRLRTLPLSVSGVLMGSLLALSQHAFNWKILVLALATTLFLQVLSNFANDYGDAMSGKDNVNRKGPERMVHSGAISPFEMKRMILTFCLLSFISGIALIWVANIQVFTVSFGVLLLLGVMAIFAALLYTIGKNPYGYSGWGDLSVFLFFGLFSVLGTYFLYTQVLSIILLFPAISMGAFSMGVLNLNNMRDYANDKATGKRTMVVSMGPEKAKYYHIALLVLGVVNPLFYLLFSGSVWYAYLSLWVVVPVFFHAKRIIEIQDALLFDKELKKLALIALIFTLVFGLAINL